MGDRVRSRRVAVYGLLLAVAVAAAGVATVAWGRRTGSGRENGALRSLIVRTVPGLCTMQSRIASGDRAVANNVFYDEVHTGAHVLAAELVKRKSGEVAVFVRAKSTVEEDLRTLSPSLRTSVDAFSAELHLAVDEYEPGLWTPCSRQS